MGEAFWSVIAYTSGVLRAGVGARWFPVASAALVTKFAGRVLPSLDGSRFSTMPVTDVVSRDVAQRLDPSAAERGEIVLFKEVSIESVRVVNEFLGRVSVVSIYGRS